MCTRKRRNRLGVEKEKSNLTILPKLTKGFKGRTKKKGNPQESGSKGEKKYSLSGKSQLSQYLREN